MSTSKKKFTITWFIENYSYCWHKNKEALKTPEFIVDSLEGTAWFLDVFPRGYLEENEGFISLFLNRCAVDDGPEKLSLNYSFSILKEDGSTFNFKEKTSEITKNGGFGWRKYIPMKEVVSVLKAGCQDILTVQCEAWTGEGDVKEIKQIIVRTRIGIKQISFPLIIESFSKLEPNQKKTVVVSSSNKEADITCNLYFSDDSWCDGTIILEITIYETKHILSRCKISLLDESGKLTACGEADNRNDAVRKDIKKLPLTLPRQSILDRKNEYLPNDKLTLLCECIFSTGVESENIENTDRELPLVVLNQKSNNDGPKKNLNDFEEQLADCTSALDDLKEIYTNSSLIDVELKTKTKTFSAHKLVLCARSSVFQAMLSNDMKERDTNCIQIDDLEDDIVQQFLLFLYSDNLENLQWEAAIKLYYAGDKYAVKKLKVICASFLLKNLNTSNASELLLLADTHNDSKLRHIVEDFILKHEKQVFGSDEWGNLLETNPLLASKTMRLKYKK